MKSAGYRSSSFRRASLVAVLALGVVSLFSTIPVYAQDATLPTKEVNITLNQAPVVPALKTLFNSVGINVVIDQAVSGLVTVSLRAVPFDVALRQILRATSPPLAYTVEDGVYNIHPRLDTIQVSTPGSNPGSEAVPTAPTAAPAETVAPQESTLTQIIQIPLRYANAALIMRAALSGGPSGEIPPLNTPTGTGANRTGGAGAQQNNNASQMSNLSTMNQSQGSNLAGGQSSFP